MKKKTSVWLGALALTGLFLAGCKNDPGPGEQAPEGISNEEQAIQFFAANDEFVANTEASYSDRDVAPLEYSVTPIGKVDEEITPLRFGRIVTQITKNVTTTIEPGDTTAIAIVEKDIVGVFKIRALGADVNSDGQPDTLTVEKPFNDKLYRKVMFRRVNRGPERFWLNWMPVAATLGSGQTVDPKNIEIKKVDVFLPNGKTITIENPNDYWLRYRWTRMFMGGKSDVPELSPGDPIKLQVTVESVKPDTDIVALRHGCFGLYRHRVKMALVSETNNGGVYTRIYETLHTNRPMVHPYRGFFHLGIDAMTRETLFSDTGPYSASWWGVPYRVF